jgi:hypothetical protein
MDCNFYFDNIGYDCENTNFDKKESVDYNNFYLTSYNTHSLISYTKYGNEANAAVIRFFTSFLSQIKKSSEKFYMIHKK